MRYIRYAFLLLLAVVLVTIALANRQIVSVHMLPEQLADLTAWLLTCRDGVAIAKDKE